MRDLKTITRLITVYPREWRRWCAAPENGGCGCMGCVRVPAPFAASGDPSDRLTEEEVAAYLATTPGRCASRSSQGFRCALDAHDGGEHRYDC